MVLTTAQITSAEVKQMTLKLFQQWALAFQSKRELVFLVDVYKELKNSGMPIKVGQKRKADNDQVSLSLHRHLTPPPTSCPPRLPPPGSTPTCACDVALRSPSLIGNTIAEIAV